MKRGPALLIAFLITFLIAGNYWFFADKGVARESVEISRVLDGDTVELADGRKIRFLNINTPEKGLPYSQLGSEFLKQFNKVDLEVQGLDRYGRTLGRIYAEEVYVNLEIVRLGMAHTYLVVEGEERIFNKAENEARKNERGIWERSPRNGCVSATINKYDEYVTISDLCGVDFTDWIVKDESTKSYRIAEDKGERFTIYSEKGTDTSEKLFWGRDKIWNDDHDEIFIRDASGLLVYYDSYG